MDLELDLQEGFDLIEPERSSQEPEWVILNRKWSSDHPWVHKQKHPRDVLDFWAVCETPSTPDSFRDNSNPDLDYSSQKSFIDKIDIKSLVDDDPESFNIDNLFAEPIPVLESRKKWDRLEEIRLLQYLNTKRGKNNLDMWKEISKELGRSVNSVRIKAAALKKAQSSIIKARKPTVRGMIRAALDCFEDGKASREDIVLKIEEMNGEIQQSKWKESVKQILNAGFSKVPGVFKLLPQTQVAEYKKCLSMNDYIEWTLNKYGPLSKVRLKEKVKEHFCLYLSEKEKNGVKVWEQTFSKKLKSCKNIDFSGSKTMYKTS